MEIDKAKVDEFTLALLYLTTFENKHGQVRAWKTHDWGFWIGCTRAATSTIRRARQNRGMQNVLEFENVALNRIVMQSCFRQFLEKKSFNRHA